MRKYLGAILGAVSVAVMALGSAADAQQPPHLKNEWAQGFYDSDGNVTTEFGAAETVAFVRGPKDFRLEVGCRVQGSGLFYRLGRRDEEKLDFAGETLTPTVTVRDAGKVRFEKELIEVNFRPKGYYQGPVIPLLQSALKGGDRIVFKDEASDVFMTFSLIGSNRTITSLACN